MADPASRQLVCTAILTCDAVHFDDSTGKAIVVGVFDRLLVDKIPGTQPFKVYFSLAHGSGDIELYVTVSDDAGNEIHRLGSPFRWPEKALSYDFTAPLDDVSFVKVGLHSIAVIVDGRCVAERPFLVEAGSQGALS